LLLINALQ